MPITAKRAVAEYRQTVIPVMTSWKIDTERTDGSYGPGHYTEQDLNMMLKNTLFFEQEKSSIMREILFARKIAKTGTRNGFPWWEDDSEKPIGHGLAAFKPVEEGNAIRYVWHGEDNTPNSFKVIPDDIILSAGLKSSQEGKSFISKNEAREALLAAQQVGIQKWGDISLKGTESYIRESIDIAAENGTWEYITNPELKNRISNTVLRASDIAGLWNKICPDTPLGRGDAFEVEKALFATVCGINGIFQRETSKGVFQGEKLGTFNGWIDEISEYDRKTPGDFLDTIISALQNNPNINLHEAFNVLMSEVRMKNPNLAEEIKQLAKAKAQIYGLDEGRKATPVTSVVKDSIGALSAVPSVIAEKAGQIVKELQGVVDNPGIDENSRNIIKKTLKQATGLSVAKKPYMFITQIEKDTEQGSFSKNLQDVKKILDKHKIKTVIPEYKNKYEILKNSLDPEIEKHERWKLKQQINDSDAFMAVKDGETCIINNLEYEWQMRETAEGRVMFLCQYDGDENPPIAIMDRDFIISETLAGTMDHKKRTELYEAIKQTLGEVERLLTTDEMKLRSQEVEDTKDTQVLRMEEEVRAQQAQKDRERTMRPTM